MEIYQGVNLGENVVAPPFPKRLRGVGKKPLEQKKTYQVDYFNDYYRSKRAVQTMCQNCGRLISKDKLDRHQQTIYCTRHSKDPSEIDKIKQILREEQVLKFWDKAREGA